MARRIVITSGKGGVGKTSFCFNFSANLARLNKKVVMLDLDLGLNNLDVVSGVEHQIVYDIVDVVQGKCRVKQALIQTTISNLFILPSSQNYGRHLVNNEKLNEIADVLSESFDYIIIDSPAGIEEGFYKAVSICNEAIVITTPNVSALRDASRVITILKGLDFSAISVVINRVRGDLVLEGEMLSVNSIKNFLKSDILGVIPESDEVGISSNNGLAVANGNIEKAFKMTAKNLETGKRELFDAEKEFRGLFGFFRRKKI